MKITRSWFIIFLFFPIGYSTQAQQLPDPEAQIQNLETVVRLQQQWIERLENRLHSIENRQCEQNYVEEIVADYLRCQDIQEGLGITAGYDNGFFVRAAEGDLEVKMTGFIKFGAGIFENDTLDSNSIFSNGVYLATDVYFLEQWHARIEIDFAFAPRMNKFRGNITDPQLQDAYIEFTGIPECNIRLGQTHVPFTIEGQYNPDERSSIWSEPFIRSWGHGRDAGVMVWGHLLDIFEYKLSLHNGEGRNIGNLSDDFLMAASTRIYPFSIQENPNTFFHIGLIRSRFHRPALLASLVTPWGRQIFDGSTGGIDDLTQGWRTGIDAGIRLDIALTDVDNVRMESEFLYLTWERNFSFGVFGERAPFLQAWGFLWAIRFQHNFTPEIKKAGLFALFKFSYSDIDNKSSDDRNIVAVSNIRGQRVWVYTLGIGYQINDHIGFQFNWVMLNLDESDLYPSARSDRPDGSDDTEHAWFFEVTAKF